MDAPTFEDSERTPALVPHARHTSLSRGTREGLPFDSPKALVQSSAPVRYSAAPLATVDINGLTSSRFIIPSKRRLAYRDSAGRVNLPLVQKSLNEWDERLGDEEAHKLKLQAWDRHARHAIACRPDDESQTLDEMMVEHESSQPLPISQRKPRRGEQHQHVPDETIVMTSPAAVEDEEEKELAKRKETPRQLMSRHVTTQQVTMQRRLFDAPRPGDEPSADAFYLCSLLESRSKGRRTPSPSIGSDEDDVYEVEQILKEDELSNRFLIRWEGFSPEHDTWEPEDNIAAPLVQAFRHRRDVLQVNAGDDCMLGRVKMLWCTSCAGHQPIDSFSSNQRRLSPSCRSCLKHHYRISSGARGTPPHSSTSVYATPGRSVKRARDDDALVGSPAPPPLPKRAAVRPIALQLSARHADLEVSRCRLYGLPTTL